MQAASQESPFRSPLPRIAAIVAVAAVLRLIFLGQRSFWADEIVSIKLATDSWHGFWFWISRREANMALYYLALRAWVKAGDSETWIRLFSALAGILIVPALYGLARRLFSERVAWIAAFIAATNACLVQFSQEARSYSLLMLLCVLSYYFFVRTLDDGQWWQTLAYIIVSICALNAHFFAALVPGAQLASMLWSSPEQRRWKRLLPAWIAIGAAAVPIALYVLRNDVGQLNWVQPTTFAEIYKLAIFFAGGSKAVAALLSVVCVMACAAAVAAYRTELTRRTAASWRVALVLTWAVVPVLVVILVSVHRPIFVHRYLLVSLPGYLLLVSLGLGTLKSRALAVVLTIYVALSGVSVVQGYFRPVEDWRGAVDYILQSSQDGDAVMLYIPYGSNNFNFYVARRQNSHPQRRFMFLNSTLPLSPAAITSPRTWLVLYPTPHGAELAAEHESALAAYYGNVQRRQFKGIEVLLFSGLKPPESPLPEGLAPRR